MAYQNLFEQLQETCDFIALEDDMAQIINALEKDLIEQGQTLPIVDVSYSKPTSFEKNNLPDDVKYAFNEGVEIYQAITSYETAIINKADFIEEVRKVKKAYCS